MPVVKRRFYTKPEPASPNGAWHLLSDDDLMVDRQRLLDRQRRFMEIAAAINASGDPDHVLRLVRDAIVESGMFDRAGVWVYSDNHFYGAWGTDGQGRLRDEHHIVETPADWGSLITHLINGDKPFYIKPWKPAAEDCDQAEVQLSNAVVALRVGEECLGVLSVDNLLSGRPVTQFDVETLLPFADMASTAIHTARMARERDRLLERQRHLMLLAAGMSASVDLSRILRMVHDAVIEAAGFDRAGVSVVDPVTRDVHGAWGTDREGNVEDGTGFVLRRDSADLSSPFWRVLNDEIPFSHTNDYAADLGLSPNDPMFGVRAHAIVPMRSSGEIVGIICADNFLTDRSISEAEVEDLLPFAQQAALAVRNARLFQDLRTAQEALLRSEKLRALGELAGGVAHNVNNLLTAVLGYAELIRQHPENAENVRRFAGIIERAGMDGAEIVRRVQQFALQQTSAEFEVIDLGTVVREALDLTRPYWKDHAESRNASIRVSLDIENGVAVSGAATELREVLVNLIRNAVDAMPDGGTLTVTCKAVGPESANGAIVEVADTGTGMDEATRKRVFEPFFTTKGPALGLGLGLSVAWGIVIRHRGTIVVDSKPGAWSKFRVTLPLATTCCSEQAPPEETATLAGVQILVVDDEPYVLDTLSLHLEHAGATVHTERSGEDGLAWLETHAGGCDIVLMDHGMPGLTGLAALAKIREAHPSISRALISGWGIAPPEGVDLGPAQVILSKPISRSTLLRSLSDLITDSHMVE